MYELKIHKSVFKFLQKREKSFLKKFKSSMNEICENPFETNCDITPIVNAREHYRLRIGKYWFLYEVNKKEIFIYLYKADNRGSVYK